MYSIADTVEESLASNYSIVPALGGENVDEHTIDLRIYWIRYSHCTPPSYSTHGLPTYL